MKKKSMLFTGILLGFTAMAGAAGTFSDDFNDGNLDSNAWTTIRGGWAESGGILQSRSDDYSLILDKTSSGVNQKIQVDAYFDLGSGINDQIAQLRLRTGNNWNTGYLADFQPGQVSIIAPYVNTNYIYLQTFDSGPNPSPIVSTGWYTLMFEVTGTGAETYFNLSINDSSYINGSYTSIHSALDSGYAGLGRLIKYDNYQRATDVVPVPGAVLLGAVGVGCVRFLRKRKTL